MYELKIALEVLPESLNDKLRSNRHALNREMKKWEFVISEAIEGKAPPAPLKKAQVSFVRHSFRMLDFDGVVGSLKPVMDALVAAGVVKDDAWGIVGAWSVDQKFRPKNEGPLLEIFVMGE